MLYKDRFEFKGFANAFKGVELELIVGCRNKQTGDGFVFHKYLENDIDQVIKTIAWFTKENKLYSFSNLQVFECSEGIELFYEECPISLGHKNADVNEYIWEDVAYQLSTFLRNENSYHEITLKCLNKRTGNHFESRRIVYGNNSDMNRILAELTKENRLYCCTSFFVKAINPEDAEYKYMIEARKKISKHEISFLCHNKQTGYYFRGHKTIIGTADQAEAAVWSLKRRTRFHDITSIFLRALPPEK